ncbi:MAG: Rrf2 family transcriptional regulator [Chloroflexi bacterium]|nr:Rrf2 family transcriptional regulator [Chloroflexota bacterium]
MRLTKGADYAARGILHLAKLPPGSVALVSDIAALEGLPNSYLAKIFQDLAREGLVHSFRGAKGGFALARPASEITLRQVIEAVEGPIALNRCLAPWEGCDKIETCALYPVLAEAQKRLLAVLDNTTLQEIAQSDSELLRNLL